MSGDARLVPNGESFDEVVVPHLDAGYRLAYWLMRNEDDAEDAVQEASLRAFRYFSTFTGGNGRAWFLRIVRNTCCNVRRRRVHVPIELFDEEEFGSDESASNPETLLLQRVAAGAIDRALDHLPGRFRTLLVLREVEGLSYRELGEALKIPLGTVMSGLSRARKAFRRAVTDQMQQHSTTGS